MSGHKELVLRILNVDASAVRTKKAAALGLSAMMAFTALSVPAQAGDGARLGLGLGLAIIGEIAKGAGKSSGRQPGRGDKLIGRVGEKPTRNSSSRKGNSVAPAAGAAAVVALALPEFGPVVEWRPDPAAVAINTVVAGTEQTEGNPSPTALAFADVSEDIAFTPPPELTDEGVMVAVDQSVPLTDETGFYWGEVDPTTAQRIEALIGTGMKPSEAIRALASLPGPQVPQQVAPVSEPVEEAPVVDVVNAVEVEQEAKPQAAKVSDIDLEPRQPPAIDVEATAAIDLNTPPKIEPAPEKPKLNIDL